MWICTFTEYTQFALETQKLSQRVYTDELTTIPNRAKFNEDIEREVDFFHRYDTDFSLAIFDIDFFKNVNDTFGHTVGDEILKSLAQLVSNSIRNTDIFARWGGEEFVIIMHQTSIEQAMHMLENLRQKIQNHQFCENISITCSFGLTQIIKYDTKETIFERADKALYLAKKNGRNCIKVVEE